MPLSLEKSRNVCIMGAEPSSSASCGAAILLKSGTSIDLGVARSADGRYRNDAASVIAKH